MVPTQTNSTGAIAHCLKVLIVIVVLGTPSLAFITAIQPALKAVDATSSGKNTLMLKERTEARVTGKLLLSGW
ncbi:hypothetical protein D3C73_826310 [compost metagenome]